MALTRAQIQTAFQNSLGRAASASEENSYFSVSQSGALADGAVYSSISNSREADLNADPVVRFYQAAFGRVPDQAGLDNATDYVRSFGATAQTYQSLANMFVTSTEFTNRFGTSTTVDNAYVTALYQTILGRTPSASETDAFVSGSNGYTTRGQVLYAISQSQEAISVSNNAVNGFLNNAATGTAVYTGSIYTAQNGQPDAPGGGGQTTALTSGTDIKTGTSGNDTFTADLVNEGGVAGVQTLGNTDSLNGGVGTDTLTATIRTNVTPASLAGIEIFNISSVDNADGATAPTLSLTNAAAITTLSTSGNGDAQGIAFTGVQAKLSGGLSISNNSTNVSVTTAAAALAGSTDSLGVTLNSVTGGTLVVAPDSGTNGYETIAVTSSGAVANTLTDINDGAGTSFTKLTVAGTQNLTVALSEATVTSIDATGFTGKLSVTDTQTAVLNVIGGTNDDTFVLGGSYIGGTTGDTRDTINGGNGNDTLSITSAIATGITTNQSNVTSIETILVSDKLGGTADATADNIDLTKFASATSLTLNAGLNADAHTFTLNTGTTININADADANSANTFTVGGSGTADALTLKLASGVDFLGTGAETFNGIETLTIQTDTTAGTVNVFANAVTLTPTAATESVVIKGAQAVTFSGAVTADVIDASQSTGVLTLTGGLANAAQITGGTAADVLNGSSAADIITGGNGADVISGLGGNDTINLTETTAAVDKVVFSVVGTNGNDTINGFTAGTGGDQLNVAALGAGAITGQQATISTAGAQQALVDAQAYVINTTGAAANLTTGGTATITDFTSTSQVAAYLNERFTAAAGNDDAFVINNGTNSYVYSFTDANASVIDAAELTLVGVVNTATLTSANVVFA